MNIKKARAVEWSPSQRCFHVQTVEDMLRDNLNVLLGQEMTDYIPIGIFEDEHEMDAFLKQVREKVPSYTEGNRP